MSLILIHSEDIIDLSCEYDGMLNSWQTCLRTTKKTVSVESLFVPVVKRDPSRQQHELQVTWMKHAHTLPHTHTHKQSSNSNGITPEKYLCLPGVPNWMPFSGVCITQFNDMQPTGLLHVFHLVLINQQGPPPGVTAITHTHTHAVVRDSVPVNHDISQQQEGCWRTRTEM